VTRGGSLSKIYYEGNEKWGDLPSLRDCILPRTIGDTQGELSREGDSLRFYRKKKVHPQRAGEPRGLWYACMKKTKKSFSKGGGGLWGVGGLVLEKDGGEVPHGKGGETTASPESIFSWNFDGQGKRKELISRKSES